jgi:hypothetical protein
VLAEVPALGIVEAVAHPFSILQLHYPVAFQVPLDGSYFWSESANCFLCAVEVESLLLDLVILSGCCQGLSPRGFRWFFEHGPCDLRDRSFMVLKERIRILQSTNAKTQYITVPSAMVSDSQYPFKANDEVEIEIVLGAKKLIVQLAPKKHQP